MNGRQLALLVALMCSGCGLFSPRETHPAPAEMAEAEALEARLADEEDYTTRWEAARLCLRVVEHPFTPKGERKAWAERALAHADRAAALGPDRVEGHYYRAVALGRVLEHATLPPLSMITELEAAGQRARECDPAFACAGPCRLLAMLYFRAPPWPIGPELAGEEEEIEKLFEEALRLAPHCPENQAGFAEFLWKQHQNARALELARAAQVELVTHEGLEPHEREELGRQVEKLIASLTD